MTSSLNFYRGQFKQVVFSKIILGVFLLHFPTVIFAVEKTKSTPEWIWGEKNQEANQTYLINKNIVLNGNLRQAQLVIANNYCKTLVGIDRVVVGRLDPYNRPFRFDVTELFKQKNSRRINLFCIPIEGPSAVMLKLDVEYTDGTKETYVTNDSWDASYIGLREQKLATSFGQVNLKTWGLENSTTIKPTDDYTQWKQALQTDGPSPKSFETLEGFDVSLVRAAKEDEDSWIAMTFDSKGRLIVSKEKKGLLRFTLNPDKSKVVKTEIINAELRECRGLLFANDALYAMANNDKALFRLRDSTGDDQFDEVEKLADLPGDVGHGRNQIRMGPDGKIYLICGDAVYEPKNAKSLVPTLANPTDYEKARSGYLARFDLKTKQWEVIARGLRNPFGIDFNPLGEIFTYDADAEYDMGASWYRPTRVIQIFPGSDFGWRRVTKKWPPYFHDRPDMPQPVLDIGKGSPTSVLFGTKSNFPETYQKALFVLDWAYGRILAVHLQPQGASYQASAETFLRGKPLNVTDLKFGPDGAMYFITGGRKTQSALYRVEYTGKKSEPKSKTEQQIVNEKYSKHSRDIRLKLESFLGTKSQGAVDFAWKYLGHDDPTLRSTARAVLEWQDVELWKQRISEETNERALLASLLALIRIEEKLDSKFVLENLSRLSFDAQDDKKIAEIVFILERLDEVETSSFFLFRKLAANYPHHSDIGNRAISRLLSKHDVKEFPKRTLSFLKSLKSPEERFHYLFVLRNTKEGWTPELRDFYFGLLAQASNVTRGAGLPNFLKTIEKEALETIPKDQRETYQKRMESRQSKLVIPPNSDKKRPFVREWTAEHLKFSLRKLNETRDLKNGKAIFRAAKCHACHRMNEDGGVLGPNLTSASGRYSPHDLLKAILKPSEVIAPKYQSHTLVLSNGKTLTGMILPGDYRSEKIEISTDPLDASKQMSILKKDVLHSKPSAVSIMPKGLLNTLSENDILDLLNYILSTTNKPIP